MQMFFGQLTINGLDSVITPLDAWLPLGAMPIHSTPLGGDRTHREREGRKVGNAGGRLGDFHHGGLAPGHRDERHPLPEVSSSIWMIPPRYHACRFEWHGPRAGVGPPRAGRLGRQGSAKNSCVHHQVQKRRLCEPDARHRGRTCIGEERGETRGELDSFAALG